MRRTVQTHPLYRLGLVAGLGLLLPGLLLAWPLWLQPVWAAAVHRPAPAPVEAFAPALLPAAAPPLSCKYFPQQVTTTGAGVVNSRPDINKTTGFADGAHIAYVSDEEGQQQIRVFSATNTTASPGVITHITPITAVSFQPAINGDGKQVAFVSNGTFPGAANNNNIFQIFRYEGEVMTPTILSSSSENNINLVNRSPSIDRSGTRVAFASNHNLSSGNSDNNYEIFLYQNSAVPPLVNVTNSSLATNGEPSISRNGRFIAFISNGDLDVSADNSDRNQELFIYDHNTITITQVTDTGGDVINKRPSINNNNRRIAFVSNGDLDPSVGNGDGNFEIFLYDKNADPVKKIYQVTDNDNAATMSDQPALSHDGNRVVFVSTGDLDPEKDNSDGNQEIFVALLENLNQITLTQVTTTSAPVVNREPAISYDGKFIAFASNGDLDSESDNSDGNFEIYRAPCEFIDLRLRKTTPTLAGNVGTTGDAFFYEFTINDDSTSPVENVTLFDTLPEGLQITGFANTLTSNCGDSGTVDGQTARCELGTVISPNTTVILNVKANRPGAFINTANLTGTLGALADARPDNNEDVAHVVYIDPTDLALTKSVLPAGEISLGDRLTYTLRGANNGDITAEQVIVTDTLPPGLTLVDVSFISQDILADDFNDNAFDTGRWQTKIPKNESQVDELNHRIVFTEGGYLVTKDQFDPGEGRLRITGVWTFGNRSNDRLQILTRSDSEVASNEEVEKGLEFFVEVRAASLDTADDLLIVERSSGNIDATLAGSQSYTPFVHTNEALRFEILDDGRNVKFTLTNTTQMSQPVTLTAATTLTSGANYIVFHNRKQDSNDDRTSYLDDVKIELTRGCLSQTGAGGTTVSCKLDNLASGAETDDITLVVRADDPETSPIVNTAEIRALQPDLNLKNNTAKTKSAIKIEGLSLEKSVSPENVLAGDPFTYILTVRNNEATPVDQVVVTDNLPDAVGLPANITSSHGGCVAGEPVVCDLGDLAGDEAATITMLVSSTQRGVLVNEALVTAASGLTATAVATAWVDPVNLSVSKTPPAGAVELNRPLTYTIKITNEGPLSLPATGVVLTDALPAGLNFRAAHLSQGQGQCQATNGVVRCTLNSIAKEGVVTLLLGVTPARPGVITNVVEVGSLQPDPNLSDNQAQAVITVAGQAIYLPVILKN